MLTTPTKWNSSWGMRHSRATGQTDVHEPGFHVRQIGPIAELTNSADARPSPSSLITGRWPCAAARRPSFPVARLLSRVVGYCGDAYRAVLTSAGPVACPATRRIFEFSGVCCAPGEPSLVAEASGVNSLKATSGLRHRVCPS